MKTIVPVKFENTITERPDTSEIELQPIIDGREYYSTSEMEKLTGLSRQTLLNRKNKIPRNYKKSDYVLTIMRNDFYSFGINYIISQCQKQLKNKEYSRWLSTYTWDYAITIGFPDVELSDKNATDKILSCWKKLQSDLSDSQMNIFYCLERYASGKGFHIHAVLRVFKPESRATAYSIIYSYFKNYTGDILIDSFTSNKQWLNYIVKKLHQNEDRWDFLTYDGIESTNR